MLLPIFVELILYVEDYLISRGLYNNSDAWKIDLY
jgi:hypothetical protein